MFGMRCTVVHNETEFDAAVADAKRDGLRVAAVSNTGLPSGDYRLTFLPASAFTNEPSEPRDGPSRTGRKPVDLNEFVRRFNQQ